MKPSTCSPVVLAAVGILFLHSAAQGQDLDQIGVTMLRATTTNINGAGIRVAQPEASVSTNLPAWEINPANVGQPAGLFTYISEDGSTNVYPNSLGSNSWHADSVGQLLFGIPGGVATNVAHVDNLDADYFASNYIFSSFATLDDIVVNQSFTFGNVSTNIPTPTNYLSVSDQQQIDSSYDDNAAEHGTLFLSAVNNGGSVSPPGTAYNCIGVAAYGRIYSSVGPTLDNGRCKPDITAPNYATSCSTPQVSGAAALLMQAALRGDGGGDTNAAFDLRTIKALLLNGAVKPPDWTNSNSSPLDARYGAGVLNVFNSYEQLAGGKQGVSDQTS